MARYRHCQVAFPTALQALNAMNTLNVMPFVVSRAKQIRLAASTTICARNVTTNMCTKLKMLTIQDRVTGVANMLITYTRIEISKKEATGASMRYADLVLMLSASAGRKKMKTGGER